MSIVNALKNTCAVKLVNTLRIRSCRRNIGNGIVGNVVYCLKAFVGKSFCKDSHISCACCVFGVVVFLINNTLVYAVVNIRLIPGVAVFEGDRAVVVELVHTSGKLYCFGIGKIVVGTICCFALAVDKSHFNCGFYVFVIPLSFGNVCELEFCRENDVCHADAHNSRKNK